MPAHPVDLTAVRKSFEANERKPRLLQEIFLNAVHNSGDPVTMFLVNGVMLQGDIAAFDLFCMLLQRDGLVHSSTSMPSRPSSRRTRLTFRARMTTTKTNEDCRTGLAHRAFFRT